MRYALAIALMLSLSFGLITESFRYQSTARLWEDDYDLLFDPARIPQIEGSRLWTGLANFVTGTEEMFRDGSQPYLLLGGMTHMGTYYPGMVYDRSSRKDPFDTGLTDPNGNPIYGEGTVTEIDWENPDTLGNYRDRAVTEDTRYAFDAHAWSDYYIAVGTAMNDWRFGLGYMHEDHKQTYTDPNDNYRHYYFTEDLEEDTLTYSDSATYAGDDITNSAENDIIFSVWRDSENLAFGLSFRYEMISNLEEEFINGFEASYATPEHPDHFYTTKTVTDSLDRPESGSRMILDLKAFYDYNETAQGRFYFGWFTKSTSYSDDAVSYYHEYEENEFDPFMVTNTTTTITDYAGDFSYSGFQAGTKQLFEISDRFRFGIGLLWNTRSVNDSTYTDDTTHYVHTYDDTVASGDTTLTRYSGEEWAMTTTGSINSFTVPVGIEFNITDPLVFRMGANHMLTKNDLTTQYVLAAWQQEVTHIEVDTFDFWFYEDPANRPEDTQENDATTTSSTSYYYGLGWMVTENLQIDVMNFSDITDWANWRVSATLHFD